MSRRLAPEHSARPRGLASGTQAIAQASSSPRAPVIVRTGQYGTSTYIQDHALAKDFVTSLRDSYPRVGEEVPSTRASSTRIIAQAAPGDCRRAHSRHEPRSHSTGTLPRPTPDASHTVLLEVDADLVERVRAVFPLLRAQLDATVTHGRNHHSASGLVAPDIICRAIAAKHIFDIAHCPDIPLRDIKRLQRRASRHKRQRSSLPSHAQVAFSLDAAGDTLGGGTRPLVFTMASDDDNCDDETIVPVYDSSLGVGERWDPCSLSVGIDGDAHRRAPMELKHGRFCMFLAVRSSTSPSIFFWKLPGYLSPSLVSFFDVPSQYTAFMGCFLLSATQLRAHPDHASSRGPYDGDGTSHRLSDVDNADATQAIVSAGDLALDAFRDALLRCCHARKAAMALQIAADEFLRNHMDFADYPLDYVMCFTLEWPSLEFKFDPPPVYANDFGSTAR
mmetsp:Transcript_12817/g.34417  ORF Transcript_12817/g.34417 Transcript_12817/m.34417 type:complete len:448 (+) Transcript_12817:72-1415(+)